MINNRLITESRDSLFLLITVVLFLSVGVNLAYADVTSLETDKDFYAEEDAIIFLGEEQSGNQIISIAVRGPAGNFITLFSWTSDNDGSFEFPGKNVEDIFSTQGVYNFTAFTSGQNEKYGVSSVMDYQGNQVVVGSSEPEPPITVYTDKSRYEDGDVVRVVGKVREILLGTPVALQVIAPNGETVTFAQLDVKYDKTFSTELSTGGPLWELAGTYTVKVLYGTGATTAQTTFEFEGSTGSPSISVTTNLPVYDLGDIIKITGFVHNLHDINLPLTIRILDPNDDLVFVDQVFPKSDNGNFGVNVIVAGPLWKLSGTYQIKVAYATSQPAQTTFIFIGGTQPEPAPDPEPEPEPGPVFDNVPPLVIVPDDITINTKTSSGTIVTYSVKAIDDVDGVLTPRCFPSSGTIFPVGETRVRCFATDRAENTSTEFFTVTVISPESLIPNWIREVAGFWCNDEIDVNGFIKAIQYLIDNNVIAISETSKGYDSNQVVPSWIKANACWWSRDLISDKDFANGIQYLISNGIIRV